MLTAQNSTCTFCGASFTKHKAKFCGKCGKPRNSTNSEHKYSVQPFHESHKGFTSSTQNVAAAKREISITTTTPPAVAAASVASVETNIATSPNKKSSSIKNTHEKQQSISSNITNTNTNTHASETQLPNVNIISSNVHNKVVDKEETSSSPPSSEARLAENNNNDNNNNVVDELNPFSTIKDSAALQIITPLMLETTNADELRSWRRGNLIGKGSFGSVYLGLLPSTGTFCAVKCVELGSVNGYGGSMYSDHSETSMRELVLLSREINLLRQLSHPNLCSFYGVYYDAMNSSINIFMEYISGGALTSIIKKFMPLPAHLIRSWTIQLLKGLAYLHSQKIIHRDIKGDNILIDITASSASSGGVVSMDNNADKTAIPANQVKLVDFGAARKLSDKFSQSRTVIGTPYWMAPEVVLSGANADEPCEESKHTIEELEEEEQEENKKEKNAFNSSSSSSGGYSYKADVWSVGCTVAEMHTGKPPWPVCANATAAILMIARCGTTQPLFEPKRPAQTQEPPTKHVEKQQEEQHESYSESEYEESEEEYEESEEMKAKEQEKEMNAQQHLEKQKEVLMSANVVNQRVNSSSRNNKNVKLNGNNTKGLNLAKRPTKKLHKKMEVNSMSSNTTNKSDNYHVNKADSSINKTNKPKKKKNSANNNNNDNNGKKMSNTEVNKLGSDDCLTNSGNGGGGLSSSGNTTHSTYNSNKSNNSNTSVNPANRLELPLYLATPGCASFMQQCCTINPSLRPSVYELLQHP